MNLGPAEILVILVVALIVFGPKRLPEVGRQVGAAMRELRRIQDTVRAEIDQVINAPEPDSPPSIAPVSGDGAEADAVEPPEHAPVPDGDEPGDGSSPRSFS
jgi:Tat protein translocase TatB subunit